MATTESNWLAALLLGVGAVAVGSTISSNTKRREFKEHLARHMRERWLGNLINCELGRDTAGVFWQLTIKHPTRGVHAVVVRMGELEPYSPQAVAFVLERVTRWAHQVA